MQKKTPGYNPRVNKVHELIRIETLRLLLLYTESPVWYASRYHHSISEQL